MTREQLALTAFCALIIVGLLAHGFLPHRHRCTRCGFLGTNEDIYNHKCSGRRAKGTIE